VLEIQGGLQFLDFDHISFTKTLDRVLGQIIREAAREWLRAVLTAVPARGGFPVLTGAAKSTLVPLGRFLKNVGGLKVTPVARKGRSTVIDKRAEGEASQSFTLESKNFNYTFEWSTDLLHYYINEYFGFIPFAPWNTLEAGQEAFVAFVEEAIDRRLPNISDYIELVPPNG